MEFPTRESELKSPMIWLISKQDHYDYCVEDRCSGVRGQGWWQVDCSGGYWKNPGKDGGTLDHNGSSERLRVVIFCIFFRGIANDLVIE